MVLRGSIPAIAVLLIVLTFLPLVRSDAGWIRMWDFPRPQLAIALMLALLGLVVLRPWPLAVVMALAGGVVAALVYNAVRILPYTPLATSEVRFVPAGGGACFSLLTANVLQDNRDAGRILQLIERLDPDILFLVETDAWWYEALRPVMARYPHVAAEPRDNTYGLVFMSRLAASEPPEVRHLISSEIPSVRARLSTPGGRHFTLYGLHPEPPTPVQSSDERDYELLRVAREVATDASPAIVTGDLNDVAWSPTTRKFRRISGLQDPRIGRGLYATFHARIPIARWPLDHMFHTAEMTIAGLEILSDIGSDHFPVFASFCEPDETG